MSLRTVPVDRTRLSLPALPALPSDVVRPGYDPARQAVGIVHLGIGAFQRAHQAIYTDDALAYAGGDWGICGVSLRSPGVRDRMVPQDCLYTAVEKGAAGIRRRIVGSVRQVLFLGEARDCVEARLADAATRIVTLTVTEKGYCHDPATGRLDFTHADIARDLAHPRAATSVVGVLVAAFDARRAAGAGALTVVCCDNLPHNGRLLRGLVAAYAERRDPALARWIAANAAFPSTMVDRIVPATTAADIADNDAALGMHDAAPVVFEPFRQWVIEDDFATARPAWEAGGAQFVGDVAPFEAMKLRLLNASHSAFAYLGFLAGHEYIHQVARDPRFVPLMRRFMLEEVTPTLAVPPQTDLPAYREALLARFANPALPHRTRQIAMDGTQKLPQRLLATARDNLAAGRPMPLLTLAVAGWMRYVAGNDEAGRPIEISDPLAPRLAQIAAGHRGDPAGLARGLLGLRPVFGDDLPADPRFAQPVAAWLAALFAKGAAATVVEAVGGQTERG
jgi:fructuronate reductase